MGGLIWTVSSVSMRMNQIPVSELFVETPDDDPELLIHIPFISPLKITGITVVGGDNGTSPNRVAFHMNRQELDFGSVGDAIPVQEIELAEDFHGAIQYPTRAARLANVTHLSLYFPTSYGEEQTRIHWIGLWGVGSEHKRQAVQCVYESQPQAKEGWIKDKLGGAQDAA